MNEYTYDPFGKLYAEESYEATDSQTGEFIAENPFKYAGQYYDAEIGQYYVRARMYAPTMRRFTGRDPQQGSFEQTMTLHRYLYCWNNPTNLVDLNGKMAMSLGEIAAVGAVTGMLNSVWNGKADFDSLLGSAVGGAIAASLGSVLGPWGYEVAGLAGAFKIAAVTTFSGVISKRITMNLSVAIQSMLSEMRNYGDISHSDEISIAQSAADAWINYWTDGLLSGK